MHSALCHGTMHMLQVITWSALWGLTLKSACEILDGAEEHESDSTMLAGGSPDGGF